MPEVTPLTNDQLRDRGEFTVGDLCEMARDTKIDRELQSHADAVILAILDTRMNEIEGAFPGEERKMKAARNTLKGIKYGVTQVDQNDSEEEEFTGKTIPCIRVFEVLEMSSTEVFPEIYKVRESIQAIQEHLKQKWAEQAAEKKRRDREKREAKKTD